LKPCNSTLRARWLLAVLTLSGWDLTTPLSPHTPTMQMLLESSFLFLHATGDEEAAQRGNRHCGGGRRHLVSRQEPSGRARRTATRVRGFIAQRCGAGAVRRDGGRWRRGGSAPIKRGSSKTGQPQVSAAEKRSGPFGHDQFFFYSFFSIKRGFSPKRERAQLMGEGATC
jgi:hypothetical protein